MTPEQTLEWLAQQHFDQCREERPIQDWIRKMKLQLPAQPAIAEQHKQEPVAKYSDIVSDGGLDPRNTTPQQPKPWVSATDDELCEVIHAQMGCIYQEDLVIARVSEAKLRELNEAPQRTWVGLTDEQKNSIARRAVKDIHKEYPLEDRILRVIDDTEAAHGIKENT